MYNRPYSVFLQPLRPKPPSTALELWRLSIDLLLFLSVGIAAYFDLAALLPTAERGFFCADTTLQLPPPTTSQQEQLQQQRLQLAFLSLVLPLAVIITGELLRSAVDNIKVPVLRMRIPRFMVEVYRISGSYLFALALQEITVSLTQHLSGRLRPHFRAVCQPHLPNGRPACSLNDTLDAAEDPFVEQFSCVAPFEMPDGLVADVRHSFPSHAAAIAWNSMSFVAFYLQARLAASMWRTLRVVLQFCCFTLATLVSLLCVCRHLHHWSDVAVGAAMGVVFAIYAAFLVADLFANNEEESNASVSEDFKASRTATNDYYHSVYGAVLPRRRKYEYYK